MDDNVAAIHAKIKKRNSIRRLCVIGIIIVVVIWGGAYLVNRSVPYTYSIGQLISNSTQIAESAPHINVVYSGVGDYESGSEAGSFVGDFNVSSSYQGYPNSGGTINLVGKWSSGAVQGKIIRSSTYTGQGMLYAAMNIINSSIEGPAPNSSSTMALIGVRNYSGQPCRLFYGSYAGSGFGYNLTMCLSTGYGVPFNITFHNNNWSARSGSHSDLSLHMVNISGT